MTETGDRSRPDGDWNHQFAEVNGLKTHYVREGRGEPLILLHGWPEFWWGWHRNIPTLAKRFDVIAPDLRGFGDTRDTGGQPAGPDVHARDILGLADALGLDRFGLVAHDVGAYVAQQIARSAPERLTGLFFFNGPYPGIGRRWVTPTMSRRSGTSPSTSNPGHLSSSAKAARLAAPFSTACSGTGRMCRTLSMARSSTSSTTS
jgi:pimeloyl-ACP methyl ester carboxylesterase